MTWEARVEAAARARLELAHGTNDFVLTWDKLDSDEQRRIAAQEDAALRAKQRTSAGAAAGADRDAAKAYIEANRQAGLALRHRRLPHLAHQSAAQRRE